jgi:hypothetical protein
MKAIELRVSYVLAVLAVVACGSSAPTDFHSVDQGTQSGSAGAQQGGSSGAGLGGSAGAPLGGLGGIASGGSGGTGEAGASAGGGLGGSAGSVQGGAAGLGGTPAVGGTTAGGGSSSGGSTGARGGTGGSGTVPYACGTLMCIQGRQMCVHTLPGVPGGTQMYQCLEYPDSCATVDCSCFCKSPMNNPCGSGSACMCSGDAGRITVQCAES